MKRAPDVVPVKDTEPAQQELFRSRSAAKRLDVSEGFLLSLRAADTKAIREGRAPTGPKWIALASMIFYRRSDLDEWVKARAVDYGAVDSKRRTAPAEGTAP